MPELILHDDGRLEGSLGSPELDGQLVEAAGEALKRGLSRTVELGGRSLFVEVFPVRPRLVVVGAVEVARSLVRLARELGFETVVIDGRSSFATPERFPDVDRLIVGWPDEVADEIGLGPNDAVAVLTHDVKFDEPAIVEALRRGCRYVGAVGSKKTQGDRRARLLEAGVERVGARASCAARSGWISAVGRRPRRPSRSSPRSSPNGTAARACRSASARWRRRRASAGSGGRCGGLGRRAGGSAGGSWRFGYRGAAASSVGRRSRERTPASVPATSASRPSRRRR